MEITDIKHLIFKNIFRQVTENERAQLHMWLDESDENRELFEKLCSNTFLQRAMLDDNRSQLKRSWKNISRKTKVQPKQRLYKRAMRIAAVLSIPLLAGIAIMTINLIGPESRPIKQIAMNIHPGSPKVVVTLPDGEQMMFDENDRMIVLADGNTHLVNESNTLSLTVENKKASTDKYTTYKIPSGGEYTIKLEDGTIVTMNSESELRAPVKFGNRERTVYFKGEGYFQVTKDSKRPFKVKANMAEIEVTGTEFNIRVYDDETDAITTLIEGSVNIISDAETRVSMIPGTQATVSRNGDVTVKTVDVYPYIAWKSGRIVFENERTEDIMRVLKRWYNCDVYYSDDAVKERRFTMDILKYDDITEILDLMSKINVHYRVEGNEIFMGSK